MPQAIQALQSGPIDIIGDVHGELDALNDLLAHLGYDQFGRHPQGRTLVFLGDLIDRGPNSPGVIEKVSGLYFARRAQCILGNHELRLINQINKPDNSWISEELASQARRNGWSAPMRVAHNLQLRAALTFFSGLPIALVRSDVKLVHACWDQESIERLPRVAGSWSALFARFRRNINAELKSRGWNRKRIARLKTKQPLYTGPPEVDNVEFSEELSDYFIFEQNAHPLKVLTQGLHGHVRDCTPFWSGHRWQMSDRQQWWNTYQDDTPVIFGHYWRPRHGKLDANLKPSLFEGIEAHEWIGPKRNCFCLDFAVGLRFQERLLEHTYFQGSLAALRLPAEGAETPWELIFDDGERFTLKPPNSTRQDAGEYL
jgi:hypothetical protein